MKQPNFSLTGNVKFLKEYLTDTINQIIGADIDSLDYERAFLEIGIDSAGLVGLAQHLEEKLAIVLYPTVFFEHNTINSLAAFIIKEFPEQAAPVLKQGQSGPAKVNEQVTEPAAEPGLIRPVPEQPEMERPVHFETAASTGTEPSLAEEIETFDVLSFEEKKEEQAISALNGETGAESPCLSPVEKEPASALHLHSLLAARHVRIAVQSAAVFSRPAAPAHSIFMQSIVGTVLQTGSAVSGIRKDSQYYALLPRPLPPHSLVDIDASELLLKPAGLSAAEAVRLLPCFATAYHIIYHRLDLEAGNTILISGDCPDLETMLTVAGQKQINCVVLAEQLPAGCGKQAGQVSLCSRPNQVNAYLEKSACPYFSAFIGTVLPAPVQSWLAYLGPQAQLVLIQAPGQAPVKLSFEFTPGRECSIVTEGSINRTALKSYLPVLAAWLKQEIVAIPSFQVWTAPEIRQNKKINPDQGQPIVLNFPGISVEKTATPVTGHPKMAIIGLSCRFPGGESPQKFWELLAGGKNAVQPYPEARYQLAGIQKSKTKAGGGFLSRIDEFDCSFFAISPAEAQVMDPQQRLFLMTAWEAIEQAGYGGPGVLPQDTGIYVGVSRSDYQTIVEATCSGEMAGHAVIGNTHSMLPSRLSYFLNLQGQSIAINTACSSSLVAIHEACRAIERGDCSMAIAGGVNLLVTPQSSTVFSAMGALSPQGQCRSFDRNANGFVCAEGVGVIVIKALDRAQADHDSIQAVIAGTALNNDGFSNGITAPSPAAQAQVIEKALKNSGLTAGDLSYIETHGTGTFLGDPIEIQGLKKVFANVEQAAHCPLGAVKTNIGHAETAAGIAGVIKTVLALKKGKIPPNLHFNELNPAIDLVDSPFYINSHLSDWQQTGGPGYAGVSSFGFNGTNAHIILEGPAPRRPVQAEIETGIAHLVTFSAKKPDQVRQYLNQTRTALQKERPGSLADVAYSINLGKRQLEYRFSTIVHSYQELCSALSSTNQAPISRIQSKQTILLRLADPAACEAIASPALREFPVYQQEQQQIASLRDQLALTIDAGVLQKFCHFYALLRLYRSWNIRPAALTGQGQGLLVLLAAFDLLSLPDALCLLARSNRAYTLNYGDIDIIDPDSGQRLDRLEQISALLKQTGPINETQYRDWSGQYSLIINLKGAEIGLDREIKGNYQADRRALLTVLEQCYQMGTTVDWPAFYSHEQLQKLALPPYPFERTSCWIKSGPKSNSKAGQEEKTLPIEQVPALQSDQPPGPAGQAPQADPDQDDETAMRQLVRSIISQVLMMDSSQIDDETHFEAYGMDSMLMKKAVAAAEQYSTGPLQASLIYQYPTVSSLAEYCLENRLLSLAPGNETASISQPLPGQLQAEPARADLRRSLEQFLNNELSQEQAEEAILKMIE